MANVTKHKKVLAIADGPDTNRARPANWNEEHVFAGGTNDGDVLVWKAAESDKVKFAPLLPAATRMIFDQDVAPLGWTRDTEGALNDRVLRIVTGSRTPNGGTWTITGLTTASAGAHSHTVDAHNHDLMDTQQPGTTQGAASGTTRWPAQQAQVSTSSAGAHTHSVGADGAWRPLHRDMIVCRKDAY